ncbi:MAG TPA: hypothetical protein VN035_14525 [Microbacterium sp.]|nr:hypothetical protein [Microbacterium sp.]
MLGEGLTIGYILLSCGVVGAVLAAVQAVRTLRSPARDHTASR